MEIILISIFFFRLSSRLFLYIKKITENCLAYVVPFFQSHLFQKITLFQDTFFLQKCGLNWGLILFSKIIANSDKLK